MSSTVTQDGITYVERDYKCLDCDWTWTQVCVKGDTSDIPECPNCQNKNRNRLDKPLQGEAIKTKVAKRGRPKKNPNIIPGMPAYSTRARSRKLAANMAFEEAQKQGFSDMVDSGLREGDICAPKLTSMVAQVQDKVFKGGWTGGTASAYTASATPSGGTQTMAALQSGIINGTVQEKYRTPTLKK